MTTNKKTFFHLSTVQKRENPGISFSWIVILVKNLRNLARRLTNLPLFMTFVRDLKEPHPNDLGVSLTELARQIGISVPAVGYSVERGQVICRENNFQLLENLT